MTPRRDDVQGSHRTNTGRIMTHSMPHKICFFSYIYIYIYIHVFMYIYIILYIYICIHNIYIYMCIHYIYIYMYVCMYVCMYTYIYIYILYIYIHISCIYIYIMYIYILCIYILCIYIYMSRRQNQSLMLGTKIWVIAFCWGPIALQCFVQINTNYAKMQRNWLHKFSSLNCWEWIKWRSLSLRLQPCWGAI